MEKMFTKTQLTEMVADRIKWLEEVNKQMPKPTKHDRTIAREFSIYFRVKYNKGNLNNYKKSEIVSTINLLDNARLA